MIIDEKAEKMNRLIKDTYEGPSEEGHSSGL